MRFSLDNYLFLFSVFLFFLVASPLILLALPTSNTEGSFGLALTLLLTSCFDLDPYPAYLPKAVSCVVPSSLYRPGIKYLPELFCIPVRDFSLEDPRRALCWAKRNRCPSYLGIRREGYRTI